MAKFSIYRLSRSPNPDLWLQALDGVEKQNYGYKRPKWAASVGCLDMAF